MATGTPATKLLKSAGIEFKEHEYSHDPNSTSFGLEAAEKLGVSNVIPLPTNATCLVAPFGRYSIRINRGGRVDP